jgi:septal ring factor EnvC (AmiA/AmiB activator)
MLVVLLGLIPVLGPVLGTGLLIADDNAASRAEEREQVLASIRTEISRLEKRFASLRDRESSLDDRLKRTEAELSLQEQRLAEATAERDWADQQVAEAGQQIAALETRLEAERKDLSRRIDGLYRLGRGGYIRLALSFEPAPPVDSDPGPALGSTVSRDPVASLLPAMRQLRFLARRDRQALDAFRVARDRVAAERRHQETRQREAATWQAEEATRQTELARVRRQQASLLAQVARERRSVASRTATLEDKARKLTSFIGALVDDTRAPLDGRPMGGFRGVLDWPVRGRVQVPFGPRRDPRYKTEIPHNGIDIATRVGEVVRTVYPGRVLFAAPFEGFGETVVVHHPGQIYSLYAGLGEVRVDKDDVLLSEAIIGTAAEALYFEIRQQNQPEDPIAWLR